MADTTPLHARIPADLARRVDREANTELRTRSSMVRVLLAEALAARELRREASRAAGARHG